MKWRERILRGLADRAADFLLLVSPNVFLALLIHKVSEKNFPLVRRSIKKPDFFLEEANLPVSIEEFSDLGFLFWNSALNRGFLRMDFDEACSLYNLIRRQSLSSGVEVGRFRGGSTLLLAAAVGPRGMVTSVDLAPKDDAGLLRIADRLGLKSRIELKIDDSLSVTVPKPLDFVFIDGDHSYDGAKRDHVYWGNFVKRGGYIIHHDMGNTRPLATQYESLKKLRADILERQGRGLELCQESGSLVIFRKTADVLDSF